VQRTIEGIFSGFVLLSLSAIQVTDCTERLIPGTIQQHKSETTPSKPSLQSESVEEGDMKDWQPTAIRGAISGRCSVVFVARIWMT
jgi:hypothetical protein